ncbi:MAG: hypothetical protein DRI90_13505, partial [Deltaproteobacteria bacterium]
MTLGVRTKVFSVSLILVGLVTLATGLVLETQLRARLERRILDEFLHHGRSIGAIFEATPEKDSVAEVDAIADRLGETTRGRVTIIGSDGAVRGDSKLSVAQIGELDSHADRPEVRAALVHGEGVSRRFSATLNTEMLYVAVPVGRPDQGAGVVRVAVPLSEVDEAIAQLRWILLAVAVLGLVLAGVVSGVASHLLTRRLRQLLSRVRSVGGGSAVSGG